MRQFDTVSHATVGFPHIVDAAFAGPYNRDGASGRQTDSVDNRTKDIKDELIGMASKGVPIDVVLLLLSYAYIANLRSNRVMSMSLVSCALRRRLPRCRSLGCFCVLFQL